jgi:cyanophycin synthetase
MTENRYPYLNASSQLMLAEAEQRGVVCAPFEGTQVINMSYQGKNWYTAGSRSSFQSAIGQTIADNKALSKVFIRQAGAPTAESIMVEKPIDLPKIATLQFPLVMKPLRGAHGEGVVIGLPDYGAAETAALAQPGAVLFEELLAGIEFRIVCVDFQFVAAAFRRPAEVVGDGVNTVQQLIDQKNQHPWRQEGHKGQLTKISVDATVLKNLAEQQLTLESIPTLNQSVPLRRTANLSTGGEAWDVTEQVCPENRALFEQIARTCDLNVIGIDCMCQTLTTPIATQPQAGIIEINKSPGLRMHHFPLQGQPINMAGKIIDAVLKYATR